MPKSVTHVLGKSVTYVPGRTLELLARQQRNIGRITSLVRNRRNTRSGGARDRFEEILERTHGGLIIE